MTHSYWEIWGRMPAVLMFLGSLLVLSQSGTRKTIDLFVGIVVTLLATVFMARGVFFALVMSDVIPLGTSMFTTLAFLTVVITLTVSGAAAVTLILSSVLGNLSRARERSLIDGLSRLLTRDAFEEESTALIQEAQGRGVPVCVIMADLDHFKHVNDSYGHPAGDQVIAAFGMLVRDMRADSDVAGRIGGEEFVIASIGCDSSDGQKFAERLRRALQARRYPFLPDGEAVTGSFGVAEVLEGESLRSVMGRVDKALYEAKQTGRNKVCVARPDPDGGVQHSVKKNARSHLRLVG